MISDEKISVIIPIYNVERYLRRCLDSVIQQTYPNIEIILVNDGSPDMCSAICEEYAQKDDRVRVIDKENGGVSSARNAGLEMASGDWIAWVDPDDWIEADMLAYLLEGAQKYQADIAICGRREVRKKKEVCYGFEQTQVIQREKAIELLLENNTVRNYLWDKLWRKTLFDEVKFPAGKTFEDVAVTYRLFEKARQIVCLPEVKYNYCYRKESIVSNNRMSNKMNYYYAAKDRLEEMSGRWPQFTELLAAQCIIAAIGVWGNYFFCPKKVKEMYRQDIKEISRLSKEYYRSALALTNPGMIGKIIIRLTPYTSKSTFFLAAGCNWVYTVKNGQSL